MKILSHFKIVFWSVSRVIQLNATSRRVRALKSKNKNSDKWKEIFSTHFMLVCCYRWCWCCCVFHSRPACLLFSLKTAFKQFPSCFCWTSKLSKTERVLSALQRWRIGYESSLRPATNCSSLQQISIKSWNSSSLGHLINVYESCHLVAERWCANSTPLLDSSQFFLLLLKVIRNIFI